MVYHPTQLTKILDGSGDLPMFAWPGGYPIGYLDGDNSILCPTCANRAYHDDDEVPAFRPVNYFIIETPSDGADVCDQCGQDISAL